MATPPLPRPEDRGMILEPSLDLVDGKIAILADAVNQLAMLMDSLSWRINDFDGYDFSKALMKIRDDIAGLIPE